MGSAQKTKFMMSGFYFSAERLLPTRSLHQDFTEEEISEELNIKAWWRISKWIKDERPLCSFEAFRVLFKIWTNWRCQFALNPKPLPHVKKEILWKQEHSRWRKNLKSLFSFMMRWAHLFKVCIHSMHSLIELCFSASCMFYSSEHSCHSHIPPEILHLFQTHRRHLLPPAEQFPTSSEEREITPGNVPGWSH